MNLAQERATVTPEELSAAYHAANLHRIRFGLARALETPNISRALEILAIALRRKEQQHGTPAPTSQDVTGEH